MMKFIDIEELQQSVGAAVGISAWVQLTQEMVDQFADLTDDHQFIHIDPDRAKQEGFEGTIVHGFFLLSLISKFQFELVPEIKGVSLVLNYGLNKVRFINPVLVGSSVRGKLTIIDVKEREEGQLLVVYETVLEIEGQEKPAFVAEHLGLLLKA